jgi:iron complex outermembrane receptor protein
MNRGLFCGASVLTVAFFTTALASSAHAAAAAPAASEVGEVVVTAEKRSTRLEKTPVAVTALTSQMRDLQGVSSVQDMTDVTPGMTYNTLANRPFIRGVGRDTDNLATESGVAVYSDGVYNGANASTILQLDSLFTDRIDVLRGPQSTLYGRNADGGAMNYISKKPTNEFEAEGRVGYANYDKWYGEAAVSGPITDSLKFRVGGSYADQTGGYFKNLDGKPAGGTIAQGGNGTSYHAELQLQGNIGDTFDAWAKVGTSDYSVSYVAEAMQGPFNDAEYNAQAQLAPNPLYGLCGTNAAGQSFDPHNPGCNPLTNQDSLVPKSVVTGPNTIGVNPTSINLHTIDQPNIGNSKQGKDLFLSTVLTWHLPGMDLKYTGGYQSFYYDLEFQGPAQADVISYQLAGPTNAIVPGSDGVTGIQQCNYLSTAYLGMSSAAAAAGCAQNLTVQNAGAHTYFIENESFYSHELNLASTGNGPVQWIGGLYWYHENYDQPVGLMDSTQPQVYAPAFGAPANPLGCLWCEDTKLAADSYAGFGQVDWQVDSQWKLTGGIRYTADHKVGVESFRAVSFDGGAPFNAATLGGNTPAMDITQYVVPYGPYFPATYAGAGPILCANGQAYITGAGTASAAPSACAGAGGWAHRQLAAWWSAWTGTAGVTWTPDKDTMAYARYSRGYKTGGFNSGTLSPYPETQPELVDAYEVGWKQVVGHVLQANAAVFYYNYSNDQIPLTTPNPAGLTYPNIGVVFNVPTATTYGLELETIWKPIDPLVLSFNYTYLNSTVTSTGGHCFVDGADPLALAPGANTTGCPTGGYQNLKGQQLPQSPPNKISLNAVYTFKFEPGNLALSGTYMWRDREYYSLFNRFYTALPSYATVNLRATWTDVKNRYTVFVFADNVFNTVAMDGIGQYVVSYSPLVVQKEPELLAPTTYGVEFQYRFR